MIIRKSISPRTKAKLLFLAGNKCQCCGIGPNGALEVDHIIPIAKGGKDQFDNYQILCYKCNMKKFDKIISFDSLRESIKNNIQEIQQKLIIKRQSILQRGCSHDDGNKSLLWNEKIVCRKCFIKELEIWNSKLNAMVVA